MKFYCISRRANSNPTTISLLKKACKKLGAEFVLIESSSYDFSRPMKLEKNSCLYSLSVDKTSLTLFNTLLREDIATVFNSTFTAINFTDNEKIASILDEKAGLPVVKSVYDLTRDRAILKNYAKSLGGFPLIIKAERGSHGVGVMKVDSFESLVSIADYLTTKTSGSFMLRQFIDYKDHARLIVLDGKIIGSHKDFRVKDDFRSNIAGEVKSKAKKFSPEVEDIAIRAVNALQSSFGGVDVLIDRIGKPYIVEVNIACNFSKTQVATGNNIALELVKFLMNKAKCL